MVPYKRMSELWMSAGESPVLPDVPLGGDVSNIEIVYATPSNVR